MPQFHKCLRFCIVLAAGSVLVPSMRGSEPDGREKLSLVVILSRHGVRSPLVPSSTLDLRSTDAWPEWEVPPGYLTPHGARALRQMGMYMRSELARSGLIPGSACPAPGTIYLYSDTDERNIDSTHNTFAGFMPSCPAVAVNTMTTSAGMRDPLFLPIPQTFSAPSSAALAIERQKLLRGRVIPFFVPNEQSRIEKLVHVMSPEKVRSVTKPILEETLPLTAASPLIEDIFLEFADGKPMCEVGWGRVDEPFLRQLIPLHVQEFASRTRTPLASVTQGSDLMAHILDTLEQTAGQASNHNLPTEDPISPKGALVVYISGHDTNLFNVGGLLGLNWTSDGIPDDAPPDAQIVFELWRDRKSKDYTVRLRYRAQTIDQLRTASRLSRWNRPVDVRLTPPGCTLAQTCTFAMFDRATRARLNPAYIEGRLKRVGPTENVLRK